VGSKSSTQVIVVQFSILKLLCTAHGLICHRIFLAETRLILSKMIWNFDLEMVDQNDWNWMNQKAYLVFEPKPLMVKLKEKGSA
jgi:hypothetical protein